MKQLGLIQLAICLKFHTDSLSVLLMLSLTSAGSMENSDSILIMANALLKNTLRARKMLDKFYGSCSSSPVHFAAANAACRSINLHCNHEFNIGILKTYCFG